jgi:glycosyltransferase involved in cell wall biosynthesis
MHSKAKISVVVPVYNGQNTIEKLVQSVRQELNEHELEIVLINDCSPDNSFAVCEKIAHENDFVKFISLRKNAGEHNAVMCGLNHITGDYVAIIDDDFQNPPSEIIKLVTECIQGDFDVVFSKYKIKKHHYFRNLGSKINNFFSSILLDKPKNLYLSSFKVITKGVVDEIIKYKGPFPYVDGLLLRCTKNISSVFVEHSIREEGESNYNFSKLVSLYFNMVFNFSVNPLRICTISGAVLFILGITLSVIFTVQKILDPAIQIGWTSIFIAIVCLSGIQLVFLGIISEYIGKTYLDLNGTPQYTIKYRSNNLQK